MPEEITNVEPVGVLIFVGTTLAFLLFQELGFRLGRKHRARTGEVERTQVSFVLSGLLGILGLMLAFAFGMSDARFQARRQLVIEEANAIGTTYLRAAYLPEPQSTEIRGLLREYTDTLLDVRHTSDIGALMTRSRRLHDQIWSRAVTVERERRDSPTVAIFLTSLNQVIDLFEARVVTVFAYRMPASILATLYGIAVLALLLLGYSAGLSGKRGLIPTTVLSLTVAVVLFLIVDLDRPGHRLFQIGQDALVDTRATMDSAPAEPPP